MKHNMKHFVKLVTILAMMIAGLAFAAPAANADTNGFQFTVTSTSKGVPTASTTLSNTQDGLVGGHTQMLWQDQNFNGHLTPTNVKQAWSHRIKVIATGANSSQVIYRMSHHRKEVVVKPGSKLRNTGQTNHIRGGFVWTTGLEVLKYDAASHQYRHAASLLTNAQLQQVRAQNPHKVFKVVGRVKLGHKVYNIVVWCGNFIGGNVVMFPTIVQVASPEDLVQESDAASVAKALVTVDFNVQCPNNGASFAATGYAYASAYASSHIRYTQHTKSGAVSAVEEQAKQKISIDQTVTADAQASITVSGTCGSTPPPPAPTMSLVLDKPNDLDQSIAYPDGTFDWSFTPTMGHVTAPEGYSIPYTVHAEYGTLKFTTPDSPCDNTPGLRQNVVTTMTKPSGTYDIGLCYIASTENPASYGGTDTLTLTAVLGGQTYTVSKTITVNPTPVIPR